MIVKTDESFAALVYTKWCAPHGTDRTLVVSATPPSHELILIARKQMEHFVS